MFYVGYVLLRQPIHRHWLQQNHSSVHFAQIMCFPFMQSSLANCFPILISCCHLVSLITYIVCSSMKCQVKTSKCLNSTKHVKFSYFNIYKTKLDVDHQLVIIMSLKVLKCSASFFRQLCQDTLFIGIFSWKYKRLKNVPK